MRSCWLCLLLLAALPAPAAKLLEYGWDVPYPSDVRARLATMQQRPFDGVVFRLRTYNHLFDQRAWTPEQLQPQIDDLRAIQWGSFSDNFLTLYSANDAQVDWFDDAAWGRIEGNLRLTAQAAVAGRCKGVCFDAEPYGANPWVYTPALQQRGWPVVSAVARRRGEQFIRALQAVQPDLHLLTLFQLSFLGQVARVADPAKRQAALEKDHYALWAPFIEGILAAAGPQVRVTDGNEGAYYYTEQAAFPRAARWIREELPTILGEPYRAAYAAKVRVGMAIYADQLTGKRTIPLPSNVMTDAERQQLVAHHVYWSLQTADDYAWFYSEKMNWWTGDLPPGLDDAVRRGKTRAQAGQPLGFELAPLMDAAQRRLAEANAAKLVRRTATIPAAASAPQIDGRLDDPLWQATAPLEAFRPLVGENRETARAATVARVAAAAEQLYVAVECREPTPDKLVIVGTQDDEPLWEGDCVELLLSTGAAPRPYRHFMLNPRGVRWDGESAAEGDDVAWSAAWRGAATIGPGVWSAEFAIPWAAVGGRPTPGTSRRANVCRQRVVERELTAWSPLLTGFLEAENFGDWRF
ncbi:MAG: hypothetical protein IT204_10865 [Fimbriimonadaceae bacterium]|nr:hypothetical protein [Fimbriimonadaceae bacterium]